MFLSVKWKRKYVRYDNRICTYFQPGIELY